MPDRPEPSIRVIMMPKDTNAHGTIFGGVILSYIDQAGAVEAKRHGAEFLVTVAMREVVFHEPVNVGDLVSFYTRLVKIGRTSITVSVEVVSQSGEGLGQQVKVTQAEVTYVNLDANRRPPLVWVRSRIETRRPLETLPNAKVPIPRDLLPREPSKSPAISACWNPAYSKSPLRIIGFFRGLRLLHVRLQFVELRDTALELGG